MKNLEGSSQTHLHLVYHNPYALCILQIGELARHLSDDFQQTHHTVPWQGIRGLRNIVAHAYWQTQCAIHLENHWRRHPCAQAILLKRRSEL
ncbi:DUF86 domain-containing protein [Anaerotruncus sp. DFI.9.16]|uniref:HepT-like ribonuclease domain-containing protein n=1 Tax=Anaerotruncus sp. DFI.9.16 TaxID=2965275 RepID=UPI0035223C77